MIGYVTGRSDVGNELSRPPEWESAHRFTTKEPVTTEVDLDREQVPALRFAIRPTHTVRSVVHSVLGVLFGVLAAGSVVLTIEDPTGDAVAGTVVLIVFAGLFLSAGVVAIVTARRGLGIDLTPDVLVLGLGGRRTVIDWTDVTSVAATTESGHDVIVVSTSDDEAVAVQCRRVRPSAIVVYYTLRFYFSHPQKRSELGTDAALRRIAGGQLT